jgi:2-polyprenyl-6-methoxyphenol hydroxylase-like FAD-dependent oxidoreductase
MDLGAALASLGEREAGTTPLEEAVAAYRAALEAGTVELLREVGLGARMDREGHPHNGSAIAWEGRPRFFIDTKKFTGKAMMAYGKGQHYGSGVGPFTLAASPSRRILAARPVKSGTSGVFPL